ncbi:hemicentin-1-like [Ruditapes philippinarum]|uniref:hemicentin-1-like n=1 Tax=Ruditapes philippinarum TaxID=129788 RepID=UPI00295B95F1|nr:hemicentin-1-like [Ruditapes philippinarum]
MGRLFSFLSFVIAASCLSSIIYGLQESSETITVNEGDNLYVACNLTGPQITWTTPNGELLGRQLNLTNVTREFLGLYFCFNLNTNKTEPEEDNDELSSVITNFFYLDVLYPAKITFVDVVQTTVQPNGTYKMHVGIEGNPAPLTTFTSLSDSKVWFNQTEEGNFTINIAKMNCTNAGRYILTCENSIGEDSRTEDIYVACVPDPVTKIQANGITTSEARIDFTTGNAFNTEQFFYIMRIMDGQLQDLHVNVTDIRDDSGGKPFFVTIKNLNQSTLYNITIISGNRWGNSTAPSSFVNFETYGKPEPDPNFVVNKTFKPRLGESVSLIIHSRGKPPPSYTWLHNGKLINSTDDNDTSIVDLEAIVVDNFGIYNLTMNNIYGTYTVDYEVLADGPPEPVSDVFVSDINLTCAHVHFTTGYNYNSTQTFIINEYIDGHFKQLKMCKDMTAGNGGDPFTCELCDLFEDTLYNITVVANNSRGESEHNPKSVKFSTYGKPKPDPDHPSNTTFKPRLGNTVTLSIHVISYPPPSFAWVHNNKHINSIDTNRSSAVELKNFEVKDFGEYLLNVSNEVGSFLRMFEILADGPPDPVANLSISTVTVSSAILSFVTGYDYNKTQTFVVMRYLKGKTTELVSVNDTQGDPGQKKFSIALHNLTMNTEYNLTIVAKNRNGSSRPSENCASFMTEGVPEPDPNVPVNNTNAPRLGQNTLFKVYAIGNPLPKFAWWHNNSPVKHTDHDNFTELEIKNVTEDDYGNYILNMQNTIGSKNYTFTIKADGPPDSVTQLSCTDVVADSVELHWEAGFDYGSSQTFQVQGSVNNKALQNVKEIKDSTDGKGGSSHFKLENLESSSQYVITLTAKNARGEAKKSNEVSFTTQGEFYLIYL